MTVLKIPFQLDVIGILIKKPICNRPPNKQVNIKFKITDGRLVHKFEMLLSNINVTF